MIGSISDARSGPSRAADRGVAGRRLVLVIEAADTPEVAREAVAALVVLVTATSEVSLAVKRLATVARRRYAPLLVTDSFVPGCSAMSN